MRAIFCIDNDHGIGKDDSIPWGFNAEDMRYFRAYTTGSPLLVGRATFDHMHRVNPRALGRSRTLHVVTHHPETLPARDDVFAVSDPLPWIDENPEGICIGGAKLFESIQHRIDELMLTRLQSEYFCDTFLELGAWYDIDTHKKRLVTSSTLVIDLFWRGKAAPSASWQLRLTSGLSIASRRVTPIPPRAHRWRSSYG
jgi:dihydrofolate reductase